MTFDFPGDTVVVKPVNVVKVTVKACSTLNEGVVYRKNGNRGLTSVLIDT